MSAQSDAVKRWLFANGIKQTMVAEATGIDKATISNYLAGRRPLSPDNCKKLAEVYGLNLTYLLTGVGQLIIPEKSPVINNVTENQTGNNTFNVGGDTASLQMEVAALRAELSSVRSENDWLRSMLEKREK